MWYYAVNEKSNIRTSMCMLLKTHFSVWLLIVIIIIHFIYFTYFTYIPFFSMLHIPYLLCASCYILKKEGGNFWTVHNILKFHIYFFIYVHNIRNFCSIGIAIENFGITFAHFCTLAGLTCYSQNDSIVIKSILLLFIY